jgi:5,10-methylenetetrahydrofolate reductase
MDTEDPLLRFVMVLQEHIYQYSRVVLGITVPVIPGIMPIQAYTSFLRVTKLCGTHIPDQIHADLESIKVLPSSFLQSPLI